MCRGLEARQALEAGEATAAPAFARPRAPRQGPPPRDASLPFRPAPGPRPPGLPRLSPPASGPPPPGLRAPGIHPPSRSLPRRPPSSSPGPAACLSALRLYLLREPGRRGSAAGSATLSRRRHHSGSPARCGAGEQLCPREEAAGGRRGGERASVRSEDTLPLSVRPGKSSRAGARRERAGGRPRGEGSRGRRNGCHVARWISAPAPGPQPLPLPHPGHSRMRRPQPGHPSPPGLAPRRLR